jgi:hypothetical protein
VSGINFDSNGVGQMEGSRLTVSSPAGAIVANVTTGEILAIVGESSSIPLRTKTGARISAPDLVTLTGENAGLLSHMLDSVVFVAPTPTPSPSATPTSTSPPLAPSVTPSR